jgi:hypothetical protein
VIGTSIVLIATYLYNADISRGSKPPPINITSTAHGGQEKPYEDRGFAIKLPLTPLKEEALVTSRPNSPGIHHNRKGSSRGEKPSYFDSKRE